MYHIHIAVIVNDRVWMTHHEHALSQCSAVLGYRGSCDFVLLKTRSDFPPDQETQIPEPVVKPKIQRKPWISQLLHRQRKMKKDVSIGSNNKLIRLPVLWLTSIHFGPKRELHGIQET